jgi:hypothetical protein
MVSAVWNRSKLISWNRLADVNTLKQRTMLPRADELDEIRWRMRVSNLEARVELGEIEVAALGRELTSPLTSEIRKSEVTQRGDAILTEISELKEKLDQMPRSDPSLPVRSSVSALAIYRSSTYAMNPDCDKHKSP